MREAVSAELELRRARFFGLGYADSRRGSEDFYGTTGAINCFAILGEPLGSFRKRGRWARRVLKYQRRDGTFPGSNGPEHALGMAIQALNILGAPIPKDIKPLAPTDPVEFQRFLEALDWSSTHKPFWGLTTPLVAGRRVCPEWIRILDGFFRGRSDSERAAIFKMDGSPPFKVVSSIYHVFAVFDAGLIPYPASREALSVLLDMRWDQVRGASKKTQCTDGDWAWLLVELCKQHPEYMSDALQQIHSVCEQRCADWNAGKIDLGTLSTHHIYCYLWVAARLQSIVRTSVAGGMLWDTLNSPQLFRI